MFEILYSLDFSDRAVHKLKTFMNQQLSICCRFCQNQLSSNIKNYATIEFLDKNMVSVAVKIKTPQIINDNINLKAVFCGCVLRSAVCNVCLKQLGLFRVNVAGNGCKIGHEDYNYILCKDAILLLKNNE